MKSKSNCCKHACGAEGYDAASSNDKKLNYGTRPFLWDADAVNQPAKVGSYWKKGLTMCKMPKKMARGEHLLRVHVCNGEKVPFCVRLKVTRRRKDANAKEHEELVAGWAQIQEAVSPKEKERRALGEAYNMMKMMVAQVAKKKDGAIDEKIVAVADGTIRDAVAELRFDLSNGVLNGAGTAPPPSPPSSRPRRTAPPPSPPSSRP